jgi:hypothetical protein
MPPQAINAFAAALTAMDSNALTIFLAGVIAGVGITSWWQAKVLAQRK